MFRSKFGSGRGYNISSSSSKNPFGRRRQSNWIFLNRRKHRQHHHERRPEEEGSVIMTRDSPAIESISAVQDLTDDHRPRHLEISTTSSKSKDEDMTDAIELQTKEPTKNGGHNGVNHKFNNHYHEEKDNDCCVKCVYFSQQCCECVIL